MKALLTIVFALVFTMSAFAKIGPSNRSNVLKYDGTLDANAVDVQYINVLNKYGSTIAAGMAVVADTSNDDGGSVTISTTAGLSPLCIMVASCSSNKLCLCQTYGYFASALFDATAGTATAGKRFYMSTVNAGYIAQRPSEAASEAPGGIFYDASSASGAVEVFIKL
jgi:hypothetical protein